MKQYEVVIKVMEKNGGYATLGFLNQEVLKVKDCVWLTRTPFASIRRIVQDKRFFFKIRPGLWALKSYRDKLPPEIMPTKDVPKDKQEDMTHAYFSGLLIDIGNLKKFQTYVSSQDKNKIYLDKTLGDITTAKHFFNFTYEDIIQKVCSIDVTWFNIRKIPYKVFEIEHTTDIKNSLIKFVELQDFNTGFYIVAPQIRKREFESKLTLEVFRSIKERINFMSYDEVSDWHSKVNEVTSLDSRFL
jgi:hypothetical protein